MENNENMDSIDNQPGGEGNTEATPQPEAAAAPTPPPAAPAPAPAAPQAAPQAAHVGQKTTVPGAVAAMIFGIVGAAFGFYLIGLVFAIIALPKLKKVQAMYDSAPDQYNNPKGFVMAGKICAWVGIGFGALGLIYTVMMIIALS